MRSFFNVHDAQIAKDEKYEKHTQTKLDSCESSSTCNFYAPKIFTHYL
jgi:ferredoxin